MRTKQVLCFNNSRTMGIDLASKMHSSLSPTLVAKAAVRCKVVILLLFIHCLSLMSLCWAVLVTLFCGVVLGVLTI